MAKGKERLIEDRAGQFYEDIYDYSGYETKVDPDLLAKAVIKWQNEDLESWETLDLMALRISQVGRDVPLVHERVKAILATRPHIPTKADKKALRIAKAKEQKNR